MTDRGITGRGLLDGPGSARMLPSKRRLLSDGGWAFGGKAVSALAVLASNALLARLLSPQDLGAYFLAFSLVSLGALLGSLGLNQAVVRLAAESIGLGRFGQTRRVVGVVFGFGGLGALGLGLAYLLLGDLLWGKYLFHAPALTAVTGLVAGWMVTMVLQTLFAETFRGFRDIRLAAIFNGLATWVMLSACLSLLLLTKGDTTLGTAVLLSAGSGLANAILASWLLHRRLRLLPRNEREESRVEVGRVLSVAWPLLVTNLTLFAITQADIWIMGAWRSQEEVAVYSVAARLVVLVAMPLVIVNAVVPPVIAEMYPQGRKQELERVLRATATLAGIPAFFVLGAFILFAGPVLGLVFGDYYREGALVLVLLSLGQLTNVCTGSCGFALMMTGHQRLMMMITVGCGSLTVAAGIGLVYYGATGVAAAAAAGLALQNTLTWVAARVATGMWTHVGVGPKGMKYV